MGKKSRKKAAKGPKSDQDVLDVSTRKDLEDLVKEISAEDREIQSAEISSTSNSPKRNNRVKKKGRGRDFPGFSNVRSDEVSTKVGERRSLLFRGKMDTHWSELMKEVPDAEEDANAAEIVQKERQAEQLLDAEAANFNKNPSGGNSDAKWMQNVVQKGGTLNDKVSAMVVLIQESPIHNLNKLDSMISMVDIKSRRACMMALDSLKELFSNHLLCPDGRKLRTFRQIAKKKLRNLAEASGNNKDTMDKHLVVWKFEDKLKTYYMKFLNNLDLVAKDTVEKSKTHAMSVFLDLLVANPEQESELLSRLVNKMGDPSKGVAAKASYSICKLLETHGAMQEVVVEEIKRLLYRTNVSGRAQYHAICTLTQMVLRQEGGLADKLVTIYLSFFKVNAKNIDTKMVSALLTGVNRAYPYANLDSKFVEDHINDIFKVVHTTSNFSTSVQALILIFHLVVKDSSSLKDRFYTAFYKKLLDFSDFSDSSAKCASMFLNLTFKCLKADDNGDRINCFVRRLIQICHHLPSHLACSILYLISQLYKEKKLEFAEFSAKAQDVEEKFDDDDEDEIQSSGKSGGWVFRDLNKKRSWESKSAYDPAHRNPAFAGASQEPCWEMASIHDHFHPSVELFASNVLESKAILYNGDPLQDFTLMRFLDRFVFRNPKKNPGKGKPSTVFSKRNVYKPKGVRSLAVDSKDYLQKDESQIPADEKFIYSYLKDRQQKFAVDDEVESVNSDDFDLALDKEMEKEGNVDFAEAVDEDLIEPESDEDLVSDDDDEGGFEEVDDFEGMSDEELEQEKKPKPKKQSKKRALDEDFAPSEEFAEILEENEGGLGLSDDILNFDRSSAKQLKWEKKRHDDQQPSKKRFKKGKTFKPKKFPVKNRRV